MTEPDYSDQLRGRSRRFAIGVLKLFGTLPKTAETQTIEPSLLRAATTLAANCRALARARSKDDFLAKQALAASDADDCAFWLELLSEAGPDHAESLQALLEEVTEITALLSICGEGGQPAGTIPLPVMPSPASTPSDFHGLRVLSFESRMANEMARLIERHGGVPLVLPALREVPIPLQDNGAVFRFGVKLILHQIDILILLTGVGTKALFDILRLRYPLAELIDAVKQTIVVARGPKPLAALKTIGIDANITVPEPNTWHDVVATLDYYRPVQGLRIAVQEYGASNPEIIRDLQTRGAEVFPVPIYRWALPEDTGPLKTVIGDVVDGKIDVMLVTNAAQIDHVMQLAEQEGKMDAFKEACQKVVVGSIGPTATERLKYYDLPVDFEPSHPKMGILVKEMSTRVHALRLTKSAG
jgi:uroporphyrinogen-III synthase